MVSTDYPYLPVKVTIRNFRRRFRALLDTGFDGYVILPASFRSRLGKPDFSASICLADGTAGEFPVHRGGAEIVGLETRIVYQAEIVLLGDECLLGQGIIKRLKVTFDHGHRIVVEP